MNSQLSTSIQNPKIRLDKWLWAARFYKTRALARKMIEGGKVRYNSQRTKPGKSVEIGAQIKIWQGFEEITLVVTKLAKQRHGAETAQSLYYETIESTQLREKRILERKLHAHNPSEEGRPNKKQRRDIIKFKNTSD